MKRLFSCFAIQWQFHDARKLPNLLILILIILFSSCAKDYMQVFDTSTTNTKSSDGYWIFENDSVKLTYEFWANKGVMSFSIFNKLDKPIYVDWKNSSFIYNGNKLDYWIDEEKSSTSGYYGGYYYKGPLLKPGYAVNEGVQVSSSTIVKPERITFIPPQSFYYRSQFYLLPIDTFSMNFGVAKKIVVAREDYPKKSTVIYEQDFDYSNSPLKVRNYIAFSISENSGEHFFVNNEFYLSAVKEMLYRQYLGKVLDVDNNGHATYSRPFKKKTSFYIKYKS